MLLKLNALELSTSVTESLWNYKALLKMKPYFRNFNIKLHIVNK